MATKKKRIKYWVLKDRQIYFREMVQIGPRGTRNIEEAARFPTERSAMQSPAYTFGLTLYDTHAVRYK